MERAFRAIREWFLSEATLRSISGFQDLNDKFTAWVHEVFNARLHLRDSIGRLSYRDLDEEDSDA